MIYLVYHQKEYYGFTYAKHVARRFKKLGSSWKIIPAHYLSPGDDRVDDINTITLYSLENKKGENVDVVSTEREIGEISKWLFQMLQDVIVEPVEDLYMRSATEHLPAKIQKALESYFEVASGLLFNEIQCVGLPDTCFVTYECFVLYHSQKQQEVIFL